MSKNGNYIKSLVSNKRLGGSDEKSSNYWIGRYLPNSTQAPEKKSERAKSERMVFFTRYQDRISRRLMVCYYMVVVIHPLLIVICSIFYFIEPMVKVGSMLAKGLFVFDLIWMVGLIVIGRLNGE